MVVAQGDASGELLQLAEIAKICRVSISTVRFWRTKSRFPVVKVGRHPLVRRADFEAFLAAGFEDRTATAKPGEVSDGRA